MTVSLLTATALWLVATAAGLDLVSVLQTLLSRPLIAGPIAGWLLSDPETGLRVGAVLELFALDVVPVGSSKYPDFGAAAVSAVCYGAGTDWMATLGGSVGLGVALATLNGTSLPMVRRLTARVIRSHTAELAAGDPAVVRRVHLNGLFHDLGRSGLVAVFSVGIALGARQLELWPGAEVGRLLTSVALAGGGWAVAHGAMASARTGVRWRWATAGLAAGTLAAWLR
jgi:mannose/fructose/N-acetylgalactosamine-specific phosphotransferase system component IIC